MRRLVRLRISSRTGLLVCVAWIIGSELGGMGFAVWRWRCALGERRTLQARLETLREGSPGLSLEAVAKSDRERGKVEEWRQTLRDACGERLVSAPPTSRSRAFFEIAQWVDHLRGVARKLGVVSREDERFGFASYARQGPSLDALERVHRQREAADALLEALFEARPHQFERLQREDPAAPGSPMRGDREEADYFAWAEERPLALPAGTRAEAFRVTFTGHTRALRKWLNRLAEMRGPVVVRDLKIEPVPVAAAAPDAVRITVVAQVFMQVRTDELSTTEAAVAQVLR